MTIINLRKHYYPLYTKDTFIEVPDEVAAVMEECRLRARLVDEAPTLAKVLGADMPEADGVCLDSLLASRP